MISARTRLVCWLWPAALLAASANQSKEDDRIHDEVMLRLTRDVKVKGGALSVEVADGVVTLKGKLRTERQKERAAQTASKVKGVKKVINQIVVEP